MKKTWYTYTMEYCSVLKNNKMMPFALMRMLLKIVTLREVKSERDKYH